MGNDTSKIDTDNQQKLQQLSHIQQQTAETNYISNNISNNISINDKINKLTNLLTNNKHLMTSNQIYRSKQLLNNLIIQQQQQQQQQQQNNKYEQNNNISNDLIPYKNFDVANIHNIEQEELIKFEREQEERRNRFINEQQKRRNEYKSKLLELEQQNIDALKIFNLNNNYNIEELKSAYKKLALKYHPDRLGNDGNSDKMLYVAPRKIQ